MSLRRIALFTRFPRLHVPPSAVRSDGDGSDERTLLLDPAGNPIPLGTASAAFKSLGPDLEVLQAVLVPTYLECEEEASVEQNRHRRQQVALIVGGLLTSIFGAVQAAIPHRVWPGIVVASVAAATTGFASVGRQSGAQDGYLVNRLRAEKLRSLYFSYLAHRPDEPSTERVSKLREQVVSIRYEVQGASR